MVVNINFPYASKFDFDRKKNLLLGCLTVGATVAAGVYQQALFALVPIFCLTQLKQSRSSQLKQPNYEILSGQLSSVENRIEQLNEKLSHLNLASTKQSLPLGQKGRVSIFIDGNNLYHTLHNEKCKIDYQLLMNELVKNASGVVGVFFYTSVDTTKFTEVKFLNYLRFIGYTVIQKDVIQHSDGSKEGNLDSEIMVGLIEFLNSYDTAILVSGDGDFKPFVEYIKKQKGRVEVASFSSSTNQGLKKAADQYVDLKELPIFYNSTKSIKTVKSLPHLKSR
jgi:uncharacterized LabA/DUF88 family protein